MKNIAVIVAGQEEPHDLEIPPAVTAQEILGKLGLSGYRLKREGSDHWFGDDENVYTSVQDGEKCYAAALNEVARVACFDHGDSSDGIAG